MGACVCVCVCVCVSERETDTQTDRQTDRQRQTERERETETETKTDRETHRETLHERVRHPRQLPLLLYVQMSAYRAVCTVTPHAYICVSVCAHTCQPVWTAAEVVQLQHRPFSCARSNCHIILTAYLFRHKLNKAGSEG